jgi:hypothetical protein
MIEIYKTKDTVSKVYTVEKNILYRKISSSYGKNVVVMPQTLVPFALAYFHYRSHSGVQKLYELMRLNYYWPNMRIQYLNLLEAVYCVPPVKAQILVLQVLGYLGL